MPLHIEPITPRPLTGTGAVHSSHVDATLDSLDGCYTNESLYARYRSICEEAGATPGSIVGFTKTVAHRGHTPWRTATNRGWLIAP